MTYYYAARSVRALETICGVLVQELGLPPFTCEDHYTWNNRLQPYQGARSEREAFEVEILKADHLPILQAQCPDCPADADTLIVASGRAVPRTLPDALREALGVEPVACGMWYEQAA